MVENIIQNDQEKPIDNRPKIWYSLIKERENKKLREKRYSQTQDSENLSFDKVLYRRLKQSEMQRGCKFNRKGERVQWLRNQYHHLRLYRAQTLLLKGFTENQDS